MSTLVEEKTAESPGEAPSSERRDAAEDDLILPDTSPDVAAEEPLPLPPDKPWLKEWMTDMRLEWLRQKVCIGLNIPRSIFNTVVQTEEGSQRVRSFLDGTLQCLLFYPDEVVTIVETIVEPPPPPPPRPPPEEGTSEDKQDGEGENAGDDAAKAKDDSKGKKGKEKKKEKKGEKKGDKKEDKKSKKGGKKGGKKGKDDEPVPEVEPDAEKSATEKGTGGEGDDREGGDGPKEAPKVEEAPKSRIIYTEKREPILCSASTGSLPEHALSANVVYFLKMTPTGAITEEQLDPTGPITEEQLDRGTEFGVLPGGPGMSSLEKVNDVQHTSLASTWHCAYFALQGLPTLCRFLS